MKFPTTTYCEAAALLIASAMLASGAGVLLGCVVLMIEDLLLGR